MRASRLAADLSDYQSRFDAHAYASAGHLIVFIKAGEGHGVGGARLYPSRVIAAHDAGLTVGHYWFCHPENGNADGQAREFVTRTRPYYRHGDVLVADVETGSPAPSVAWLATFARVVRETSGHTIIGYSYQSYLSQAPHLQVPGGRWWIASYSGTSSWLRRPRVGSGRHCHLWQYTDGDHGAGPRRYAGIGACDGSILSLRFWRDLRKAHRKAHR